MQDEELQNTDTPTCMTHLVGDLERVICRRVSLFSNTFLRNNNFSLFLNLSIWLQLKFESNLLVGLSNRQFMTSSLSTPSAGAPSPPCLQHWWTASGIVQIF